MNSLGNLKNQRGRHFFEEHFIFDKIICTVQVKSYTFLIKYILKQTILHIQYVLSKYHLET